MSADIDPRLIAIFSTPAWSRFVETLATYRNRGKALPGSVTLSQATDDERRSYSRLLRLKKPAEDSTLRYQLAKINAALAQQGIIHDWPTLLTVLHGSPPESLQLSQENRKAWAEFWAWAAEYISRQPFPCAEEWLRSLRRDGSLIRLAKGAANAAQESLEKACHVLTNLPLTDEPLPSAAARLCGNSHALDPDSPLSSLILRSLAMQRSIPMPERSDDRRQLWEDYGIICDNVSAPVLTLNLGLCGPSWLCGLIAEASAEAQPLHLTNRMIATADWSIISSPEHVFICENPTIIALAANQLRQACPPMICVNGEPRSTSRALLRRLRERGTTLWYHGDFDGPGIAIASRVIHELGAQPWMLSASDYEQAIRHGRHRQLADHIVSTPWCPELAPAMNHHAKAVDEEAIAELLLQSLNPLGIKAQGQLGQSKIPVRVKPGNRFWKHQSDPII